MSDSIAHENSVAFIRSRRSLVILTGYQNRAVDITMSQWHSALEERRGTAGREGAVLSQGAGAELTAGTRRAGAQQCIPYESTWHARAAGGGGGAAPSVATAGRPRLERRCAPQPRAPSEQDAHTRLPPARPTILALEPSDLIPIYLARLRSLMFLQPQKGFHPVKRPFPSYVDARDRDAAWSLLSWLFRYYVTIERACCLTVNVHPWTHCDYYNVLVRLRRGSRDARRRSIYRAYQNTGSEPGIPYHRLVVSLPSSINS